jgi:hypothetical protein
MSAKSLDEVVLLDLARVYAEHDVQLDAAYLADQTESKAIAIAAVGQFKRGKSTLLNALLGADVLPMGRLPLTGVVTRLRYGDDPQAVVHYLDGRRETVPIARLADYVTEESNPENERGVERVDAVMPLPLLRHAMLVDTPGIGSTLLRNTQTAHEAIGRIDLALFVTGPEPPITQDEADFLAKLRTFAERIFVIVTKIDRAGNSVPEILRFTDRLVTQALGQTVPMFALDGNAALAAAIAHHDDPRLEELRSAINAEVDQNGSQLFGRSREKRIKRIGARIIQSLELRRAALLLPRQERARARKRFAELAAEIQERAEDLVHAVDRFPDDEMRRVDVLLGELADRAAEVIHDEIDALAAKPFSEAERALYSRIATIEQAWSDAVAASLESQIGQRESSVSLRVTELEERFLKAGCEALGLQSVSFTREVLAFGKRQAVSRMAGPFPTTGLEIITGGLAAMLPGVLGAQALRWRLAGLVPQLLDRSRGRIRSAALEYLNDWRHSYRARIVQRLAEARRVVEDAFIKASEPSDDKTARDYLEHLARDQERLMAMLDPVVEAAGD